MFCFTLYFQKDITEYIAVTYCIIISFWILKSHSFTFIRFHLLCHSFSFVVSLVDIRCHSMLLVVVYCQSCHSLSPVFTRCHSFYQSLSFVVTRCTTRLSFCARSKLPVLFQGKRHWRAVVHRCSRSRSELFFIIEVLKIFAIFTKKHLCWRLFLIKLNREDLQLH